MVDLPKTMVDHPNTMNVLTVLLSFFTVLKPFLTFLTGFCPVLTILIIFYHIDRFLPYRHGLMVFTPPMVFAQTDGIVLVLLDHTRTKGPSVAHMRNFKKKQVLC